MTADVGSIAQERARRRKALAQLVRQPIPRRPTTWRYRASLGVVAAALLTLPLIYAALILATLVGLALLFTHGVQLFGERPDRLSIALFLALAVGGPIFLVFLLKPLFARSGGGRSAVRVDPEREPFLYEYVDALCGALGAPTPRSIYVDCQPNASASFTPGLGGFLRRELELTIGLPLIAGMPVAHLTGILAHEFGHFAQGTGMRFSFTIRTINAWLLRLAYERDGWDERLERWGTQLGGYVWLFTFPARSLIWLTRRFSMTLLWLSHILSGYMSQQMEYDADRCETLLGGSRTFAQTSGRLRELNVAGQFALGDLERFHQEGRLPNDLPALIVASTSRITPRVRRQLRQNVRDEKGSLFQTHPPDRLRIQAAAALQAAGSFARSPLRRLPATVLLDHFPQLCRRATVSTYEEMLGEKDFDRQLLRDVDELIAESTAEVDAFTALRRYFQTDIPWLRPLPIADAVPEPESPKRTMVALKTARESMLAHLDEYKRCSERYQVASGNLFLARGAATLSSARVGFDPKRFELADNKPKTVREKCQRVEQGVTHLAQRLLPFETAAAERLSSALQLLHVPKIRGRVEHGDELLEEVATYFESAKLVSRVMEDLPALQEIYFELVVCWDYFLIPAHQQSLYGVFEKRSGELHTRLSRIGETLGEHLYPFRHRQAETTIRTFALPVLPEAGDLPGLVNAAETAFNRLTSVQARLFARLSHIAEQVEVAIGLTALPDPEDSTTDGE